MGKRIWLLAAGAAAVAAIVGAGVVMAQSGEDANGRSFLDRVAEKLGIETPQLEQAIDDARDDVIDERVAEGDLTQEEADELKERLDALPDGAFGPGPGFGFGLDFEVKGGPLGFAFRFGEAGPGFAICAGLDTGSLAEFLGISQEQLVEELRAEDATIASVAEAHGKTRDELKAFIEGETKAKLDEAVANGKLTQERADEILGDLSERIDELIDGEFPGFGIKGRFFHDGIPFAPSPMDEGEEGGTPEQSGELDPASRS